MIYKDYLKTNHWNKIRNNKLKIKNKCEICGWETNLQIHHRRYKDKYGSILFREYKTDLKVLCDTCHNLWHKYFKLKKTKDSQICRIKSLFLRGLSYDNSFKQVSMGWKSGKKLK